MSSELNDDSWEFADPPNVAVFTDRSIIDGTDWIHYVTHDEEDGAWQFLPYSKSADETSAKVVGLKAIVELDPSVIDLADLPFGWCAWRKTRETAWTRSPKSAV